MVDRVRVQRAIDDFFTRSPNSGTRCSSRSSEGCTASEALLASKKAEMPANMAVKMTYQYSTNQSEMAITSSVGAGRSASKFVNTYLDARITNIMITAVM